jgi:hypothetical protein
MQKLGWATRERGAVTTAALPSSLVLDAPRSLGVWLSRSRDQPVALHATCSGQPTDSTLVHPKGQAHVRRNLEGKCYLKPQRYWPAKASCKGRCRATLESLSAATAFTLSKRFKRPSRMLIWLKLWRSALSISASLYTVSNRNGIQKSSGLKS